MPAVPAATDPSGLPQSRFFFLRGSGCRHKQGLCPLDLMKIHGNMVNLSGIEVKNRGSHCLLRETEGCGTNRQEGKGSAGVFVLLVCLCCWCVCVAGALTPLLLRCFLHGKTCLCCRVWGRAGVVGLALHGCEPCASLIGTVHHGKGPRIHPQCPPVWPLRRQPLGAAL